MKDKEQSRPRKSGLSSSADNDKGKRTEPGYQQLLKRLDGVSRRSATHPKWIALCPCHDDTSPSFVLDYKENRWGEISLLGYCKPCGANLAAAAEAVGLELKVVLAGNDHLGKEVGRHVAPAPNPRPSELSQLAERLWSDDAAMQFLRQERGLNRDVIRQFGIGWDGGIYHLPVYENGDLITVRRYNRYLPKGRMRSPLRHSVEHLYPNFPKGSWVLLCEGEFDALVGRSHGLPTLTTIGGVGTWKADWNRLFHALRVAIVYDCDKSGRDESDRRAGQLVGHASVVKVVDLGLGDKEDLTDWFVKYRRTAKQLRSLISRTEAFSG